MALFTSRAFPFNIVALVTNRKGPRRDPFLPVSIEVGFNLTFFDPKASNAEGDIPSLIELDILLSLYELNSDASEMVPRRCIVELDSIGLEEDVLFPFFCLGESPYLRSRNCQKQNLLR